jgi:hypothetical protein
VTTGVGIFIDSIGVKQRNGSQLFNTEEGIGNTEVGDWLLDPIERRVNIERMRIAQRLMAGGTN